MSAELSGIDALDFPDKSASIAAVGKLFCEYMHRHDSDTVLVQVRQLFLAVKKYGNKKDRMYHPVFLILL